MIYNKENEHRLRTVYWTAGEGEEVGVLRAAEDVHIGPDIVELMALGYTVKEVDDRIQKWKPVNEQ